MTEANARDPLTLIDRRTTGLVRLGVSTDAARGKTQGQGRKPSQAIYDQTDAQGLIYVSRLTGRTWPPPIHHLENQICSRVGNP